MDRTLLGVAAVLAAAALLVFSGGYLVRSVPQAEAQDLGPVFSGGGMPLLFFSGTHNRRTTTPSAVYTVPAGKTFVMTAACLSQTYLSVTEDGVEKWEPYSGISDYSSTDVNYMCSAGNGQIPFASGSVVGVAGTCPSCSNSSYAYALQGYLVAN
jgi:hypothetical protein